MSIGFRLLLLTLLGFGAVWIYRFRAPELNLLLNPAGATRRSAARRGFLERDLGRGAIQPPPKVGFEAIETGDWNAIGAWAPGRSGGHSEPELPPWDGELPAEFLDAGGEIPGDPELALVPYEDGGDDPLPARSPGRPAVFDAVPPREEPVVKMVEIVYTVVERDNLWKIAEKHLGKGRRYGEIMELNSLSDDRVFPGTQLRLRVPEHRIGEEILKSTPRSNDKSVEKGSGLRGDSLPRRTHKVKARETLGRIARMYLGGNPAGVQILFEANRATVSSRDKIREGQIPVIPSFRP